MAAIYGHRWTSAYGDACEDDSGALTLAGDTWRRGLFGVSDQSIGRGLDACVVAADPWPPTLPQFRAMTLGVPSLASVQRAILKKFEPTPFVRLVWQHLDGHRMKLASSEVAERLVRDAYEQAREAVMRGEMLPEEPEAVLSAPVEEPRKPADPETIKKHCADLQALLGDDQ